MIACAPEANPPVDLVNVDDKSSEARLEAARALCGSCPALARCRPRVLRLVVAGFAGGLTQAEREAWQRRHHVRVEALTVIDVTPAHELTGAELDSLPDGAGALHPDVIEVVLRMSAAGVPAETIVDRLDRDDVTRRTVNYIRRTYAKGPTRVDI